MKMNNTSKLLFLAFIAASCTMIANKNKVLTVSTAPGESRQTLKMVELESKRLKLVEITLNDIENTITL